MGFGALTGELVEASVEYGFELYAKKKNGLV